MRMILLSAALISSASAEAACNSAMIEVQSWSIRALDSRMNELTTIFVSKAEKPIRMIDASASFTDALGESIGPFRMERDVDIAPGEIFTVVELWGPNTFERLLELRPNEVEGKTCVRAVLYDDGTKETFK